MKPKKETPLFLRPLMVLLLLCFTISFSGYSNAATGLHVVHTEWIQDVSAPKKAKTAAFSAVLLNIISEKYCYAPYDFSIMQVVVEKDLMLKGGLLNFNFSNYKLDIQKGLFKASLERSAEAPPFSEPV